MKYRMKPLLTFKKKPVIVDAVQITEQWFSGDHPNPLHPIGVLIDPKYKVVEVKTVDGSPNIGQVGDYLVTKNGEMTVCRGDYFRHTYEEVE